MFSLLLASPYYCGVPGVVHVKFSFRLLQEEAEGSGMLGLGYCGTFKAVPVTVDDSLPEDVDVQILGRTSNFLKLLKIVHNKSSKVNVIFHWNLN
jgi:hypothetical protein